MNSERRILNYVAVECYDVYKLLLDTLSAERSNCDQILTIVTLGGRYRGIHFLNTENFHNKILNLRNKIFKCQSRVEKAPTLTCN